VIIAIALLLATAGFHHGTKLSIMNNSSLGTKKNKQLLINNVSIIIKTLLKASQRNERFCYTTQDHWLYKTSSRATGGLTPKMLGIWISVGLSMILYCMEAV